MDAPAIRYPSGQHQAIYIDQPSKQKSVWLAFSAHRWSEDTFTEMAADNAWRARRMQRLEPQQWLAEKDSRHAVPLSAESLKHVIEFNDDFTDFTTLHNDAAAPITEPAKEDLAHLGDYDAATLRQRQTAHHLQMHSEEADTLIKTLGHSSASSKAVPLLFAFWDAVGIAEELNSFTLDPLSQVSVYQKQLERHIQANAAIQALEEAIIKKGQEEADEAYQNKIIRAVEYKQLKEYGVNPYGWPPETEAVEAKPFIHRNGRTTHMVRLIFPEYYLEQQRQQAVEKALADWRQEYNVAQQQQFANHYETLLEQAQQLTEQRGQDLVNWLRGKPLIDSLTEYHPKNIDDGAAFEQLIADILIATPHTPAGDKLLTDWASEARANDKNLYWRAIASNQTVAINSLNLILKQAEKDKDVLLTESSLLDIKALSNEMNYFHAVSKKIYEKMEERQHAKEEKDGKVTQKTDKLSRRRGAQHHRPPAQAVKDGALNLPKLSASSHPIAQITVIMSQRVLFIFSRVAADTRAAFIIEGILHIRCNIPFETYRKVILQHLKDYDFDRKAKPSQLLEALEQKPVLQRKPSLLELRNERAAARHQPGSFSRQLKNHIAHYQQLKHSYALLANTALSESGRLLAASGQMLKTNVGVGGAIDVVFILLQGMALKKLIAAEEQYKSRDIEYRLLLTTTSANLAAVSASLAEGVIEKVSQNSRWLTPLKTAGGVLGVVTSAISTYNSGISAGKNWQREKYGLALVYVFKAGFDLGATASFGLAALAALNPDMGDKLKKELKEKLLKKLKREAEEEAVDAAVRYGAVRFFMLGGLWFGLAAMAIDIGIFLLSDSDMQNWLQASPFGRRDDDGELKEKPFASIEAQQEAFEQALLTLR